MFAPQKGKAFENLPAKSLATFNTDRWLVSKKYDGNQIFITKISGRVRMFTSDWKEFCIKAVANEVHKINGDFVVIGEFMQGCHGRLGDRVYSAILTTYRINFNKRLDNANTSEVLAKIKVFDMIMYDVRKYTESERMSPICNVTYEERLKTAIRLLNGIKYLSPIDTNEMSGSEATELSKQLVKEGWEGVMCVRADSIYQVGKRVNYSVKLKHRKTADLLCIGTEDGEGKYEGLIGSLILEDSTGRVVSVGSGLSDSDRHSLPTRFIGRVIEIEYEQIIDTYIQPTYVCIRENKEID